MSIHQKIRSIREANNWTQEDMAEKLNISKNGYAKLERGENKLNIERLEQISHIFNIDISDLVSQEKGIVLIVDGSYADNNSNVSHYTTTDSLISENEKLKLIIEHKNELLQQLQREVKTLNELVTILKK